MKIRFKSRISGYSKVAYGTKECEATKYQILHFGDEYVGPVDGKKRTFGESMGLMVDDRCVYVLKPGSKVEEIPGSVNVVRHKGVTNVDDLKVGDVINTREIILKIRETKTLRIFSVRFESGTSRKHSAYASTRTLKLQKGGTIYSV